MRSLALLALLAFPAHADLITEIGGGIKFGASYAVDPRCSTLIVPGKTTPEGAIVTVPCGGDDPVFVGWPIAWDFPNGLRFGLFHYSNWFDGGEAVWFGGDKNETNFNCLCVSKTIHWRRHRR